ncbi:MAG: hypothetical protein IH605_18105 [Burkholderiales bacterium]|nr:hypothetical protein [Burkholderiales bacterium]
MTKAGFWKTEWLLGAAAIICIVLRYRAGDLIPGLLAFLDKAQTGHADQRHQTDAERAATLRAVFGGAGVEKPVSRMCAAWI